MTRLAERTWLEVRRLARDPRTVVLLPLGAVEQHGPHLPLLVDWLGAEELARRLAPHLRRAGWKPLLAPRLPYGASPLAADWPGTVSLSVATLRRVIVEVVRGLAAHGFRRIVITNYQADPGQLRPMALARRAGARGRGRRARARSHAAFRGFLARPGGADAPAAGHAAHAKPPPRSGMALGRARDVDDAGGVSGSRPARSRAPAAAGVGGLARDS